MAKRFRFVNGSVRRLSVLSAVLCAAAFVSASPFGEFGRDERAKLEQRIAKTLEESAGRSCASGVVTFAKDDFFFIQRGDEALKAVLGRLGDLPRVGAVVEVCGRPVLEGGRVIVSADGCRVLGSSPLPEPRAADSDALTYAAETDDCKHDVNWLRVKVVGRAMGVTENGFTIDVDGLPVSVTVAGLPDFLDDCEHMHPRVEVHGVAELVLDQSALFGRGRYVLGVRLCSASASDIALLPDLGYALRKRGRKVTVTLSSAVGLLAAGILVFIVITVRQRRNRLLSETVMAERKRMADDLHDTIEQHLAGAGMLLKLARLPANRMPSASERPVKEAQDVLLRAKSEMRDIVWGLKNDDMMRMPPAEMLRAFAHEETRKGIVRIRTRLKGLPQKLDASKMRDLSLIVREAVGNAVKHGGARKIAVVCDPLESGGWHLRVANDGAQFDLESAPGPSEGHFGLEGMRQRSRRIGATIDFTRRGKWTIVSIRGRS